VVGHRLSNRSSRYVQEGCQQVRLTKSGRDSVGNCAQDASCSASTGQWRTARLIFFFLFLPHFSFSSKTKKMEAEQPAREGHQQVSGHDDEETPGSGDFMSVLKSSSLFDCLPLFSRNQTVGQAKQDRGHETTSSDLGHDRRVGDHEDQTSPNAVSSSSSSSSTPPSSPQLSSWRSAGSSGGSSGGGRLFPVVQYLREELGSDYLPPDPTLLLKQREIHNFFQAPIGLEKVVLPCPSCSVLHSS